SGNAMPTSTGMMGGYPATVNVYKFLRNSDVAQRLADRDMPSDIADLQGTPETLALRQQNFTQHPSDVYAVIWTGGGGFGDPLQRDAQRVWHDVVETRSVSRQAAAAIYGVVVNDDESLDQAATDAYRHDLRQRRRAYRHASQKGWQPGAVLDGPVLREVTEQLVVRAPKGARGARAKQQARWSCRHCATDLGPIQSNYKDGCARHDAPIEHSNPNVGDWRRYIDHEPVFRQFFCPGCGALIENEVARIDDPPLNDIALTL
ncbi:MAG: acetone carboxylase subunit gamma, partial [Burkholderiaceae bacterium]